MKKIIIASLLAFGMAAGAGAQMMGGPISRADFLAVGKAQFTATDADHDGVMTKDELSAAITKQMGSAPPQDMIDQIFKMLDTNGDGKATAAEVEASQASRFDQWDTNHDATLTPEEAEAGRAAMMAAAPK